jgi:hypothetical protein
MMQVNAVLKSLESFQNPTDKTRINHIKKIHINTTLQIMTPATLVAQTLVFMRES